MKIQFQFPLEYDLPHMVQEKYIQRLFTTRQALAQKLLLQVQCIGNLKIQVLECLPFYIIESSTCLKTE